MPKRNPESPFTLTRFEKEILEAIRLGFTHKEIKYLYDLSPNTGLGTVISNAVEKEQTAARWQAQMDHSHAPAVAKTARGNKMERFIR